MTVSEVSFTGLTCRFSLDTARAAAEWRREDSRQWAKVVGSNRIDRWGGTGCHD
jgi:hypothetical protein